MRTILVTGGAGFIGSHIVDKLIENGDKVIVVDNLSTGKQENIHKKATFYKMDITDKNLMKVFKLEHPHYVIHEAAQIDVQKSMIDPVFDGHINILGSINLLECCRKYHVKKIIYASSAAVYGNPEYLPIDEGHRVQPISYYGISKHTPEQYIEVYHRLFGIDYTILRYANVYGIRQEPKGEGGVISIFMDKMFKGQQPTIFGDGRHTRDFIYVEDIVQANLLALEKGNNEIFNVGTGIKTSIETLYQTMADIIGCNILPNYSQPREGDILHSYYDILKAKQRLGFEPKYTLQQGLSETIEYYKTKNQENSLITI